VDEPLDARLELDESAVIRDAGDFALDYRTLGIAVCDPLPGERLELLETQGDALPVTIELQDLDLDLVSDVDQL